MKAWRLRDIERLAIQQWVADNFGKASDGRRMERAVLLSSILEGWNWRHRSALNGGVECRFSKPMDPFVRSFSKPFPL